MRVAFLNGSDSLDIAPATSTATVDERPSHGENWGSYENEEPETPTATLEEWGEWIVNTDTGEIVDCRSLYGIMVTDRESAEQVLAKFAEADKGILAEIAEYQAVTERIQARLNHMHARKKWLTDLYGHDLDRFAAASLSGAKRKSVPLTNGAIGYQRSQGSVKVVDMQAAVAWAKQHCCDAIRETVVVKPIKDAGLAGELPPCFSVSAPKDTFYIRSGIKLPASLPRLVKPKSSDTEDDSE